MNKRLGIITLGGAFNPIHTQHVEVLNISKKYLESTGWNILGGYCAISTEGYVRKKLNHEAMKHKHRSEMVKLSYQNCEWMSQQPLPELIFHSYGSAQELGKKMKKELNRDEEVQILVIVGADRIMSGNVPKWRRNLKVDAPITVCVGRGDSMDMIKNKWEQDSTKGLILQPDKWILIDASAQDVSSTKVRQQLKVIHQMEDPLGKVEGIKSLVEQNLLFENVSDYILFNEKDLYH